MNITRYEIKGRAHIGKINSIIRHGFEINNIISEGKSLQFDLDSRKDTLLVAFLDQMCYDYSVKNRKGILYFINTVLHNKGLFIGIIISIAMLISSTFFAFDVIIIGNERVETDTILASLEEIGLRKFSPLYVIDRKGIENKVVSIDGIADVSVEIKGVRVYIKVREELLKPDINDYITPTPIKAEHDSVVTRIVVLTGTAAVKKGDTVLKGSTLIYPYYTDGAEEDAKHMPIKATGIVYGRVWYKQSVEINKQETMLVRSGNTYKEAYCEYILEGAASRNAPYEKYEVEENTVIYNSVFPLRVTYLTYYELIEVTVERDIDKDTREIINRMYLEMRDKLPNDAVVLRMWNTVKEVDNKVTVDIYLETEQRIDGGTIGEDNH